MRRSTDWSRRALLRAGAGLGAGASLLGLPRITAADGGSELRFIFVFARGGWDTTRVFSPMLGKPRVETEADASVVELGDLTFVDHPDRPSVRSYFESYGHLTSVIDAMLIRSVNHSICERLVQTGGARPERPDWSSILGSVASADHALPTIVLDGPSNAGPLHRTTSIVGASGQLQGLLDGTAFERGDRPVSRPEPEIQDRIDELAGLAASRRLDLTPDPGWQRVYSAQVDSLQRLDRLRLDAREVGFSAFSLDAQADTAVDILSANVARCVCIGRTGFDSHGDTISQSPLLDELFTSLSRLLRKLASVPGRTTPTLAGETVVVVQSEMGRTPYLNQSGGKDHWPYTAAMVISDRIRGGQRLGGYDDMLSGRPMDLRTGEPTELGTVVTPEHLGATLLTLAGLDPGAWVESPPIGALLP